MEWKVIGPGLMLGCDIYTSLRFFFLSLLLLLFFLCFLVELQIIDMEEMGRNKNKIHYSYVQCCFFYTFSFLLSELRKFCASVLIFLAGEEFWRKWQGNIGIFLFFSARMRTLFFHIFFCV